MLLFFGGVRRETPWKEKCPEGGRKSTAYINQQITVELKEKNALNSIMRLRVQKSQVQNSLQGKT